MTSHRTRPAHHAGRPDRRLTADALYTYNCRAEYLHLYDANPFRFRDKRATTARKELQK